MESQKIKEDRRSKFLKKMEMKNKPNKKESNNNKLKQTNKIDNIPQDKNLDNHNQTSFYNKKSNLNEKNLNQNNEILNQNLQKELLNNIFNNQSKKEIDFKSIIEQQNKYDYMMNFQNIIKKILIIILSIIHCINYPPLDNEFVFKYTFIILELSSFFFNRYYYSKKADLRKKMINSNIDNDRQNQIEKLIQTLLNNFGFLSQIFVFFKAFKDVISDISILISINVIYFIIKSKD